MQSKNCSYEYPIGIQDFGVFSGFNQPSDISISVLHGYLTIKAYTSRQGTFLPNFPNNEVKSGFVS